MRTKKSILFLFSCLFLLMQQTTPTAIAAQTAQTDARDLVKAAIEAMGGEAKLRALKSLQFEGIGHSYFVEQSERPEGPWIVSYQQTTELRDIANQRLRSTTETKFTQVPQWSGSTLIVADGVAASERGGRYAPAGALQVEAALQKIALAPEQILFKALEATDLRLEKDTQMQSVSQKVLKFTYNKMPVTIYLNAATNLPTAVETLNSSPYDHLWTVWGNYSIKTYYTYWNLEQGGLRYPHQMDIERNGTPFSSFTILKMQVNAPIDEKLFAIPDDVRRKFAAMPKPVRIDDLPLGRPDRPAQEILPGVVKVPGRWDVAYVKQPDGIIIIEAPISSGYSVKVLEEAKRRFPDSKVKAVITTSDAFPHLGGVREYAAQGIQIYALDVNRPILERLIAAPHTFEPDALQNKPRKANFKFISAKTILGDGTNRLELYPIRSETGERMLMVYFPEHQVLYASDLVQKSGQAGGFFMPQYLTEVIQSAGREKLSVNKVFAMHLDITPWTDITTAVEKQIAGK